jgi:hypothetical protein
LPHAARTGIWPVKPITKDSAAITEAMEIGLTPTGSARWPAVKRFVAFLSQIPPIGPVLPTGPVYKPFAVNNLMFVSFHGMEEVIGSIPIRSTNQPHQNELFPGPTLFFLERRRC